MSLAPQKSKGVGGNFPSLSCSDARLLQREDSPAVAAQWFADDDALNRDLVFVHVDSLRAASHPDHQ